jgi:DNA (cytosine-5)-methyltransferase 1
MKAYYNEHDKNAAAWIRELIKEGVITDGEVDERSIEDVLPADLAGFDRCHFFAGIGVWDYALNLAGWEGPVWTGSCPCQPFSAAGKGEGFADERHLWPAWFHLIEICRPDTLFGEQVSSADGRIWLDLVHADLEAVGYTVGTLDIPVCSVGAPHRRQRFFFVADPEQQRELRTNRNGEGENRTRSGEGTQLRPEHNDEVGNDRTVGELEKPPTLGRRGRGDGDTTGNGGEVQVEGRGSVGELGDSEGTEQPWAEHQGRRIMGQGSISDLENSDLPQSTRFGQHGGESLPNEEPAGFTGAGPTNGFWRDAEWIYCRDEKYRPTKPGIFPLVNGATGRVALLRGAGNAISPWVAKAFIESVMDKR